MSSRGISPWILPVFILLQVATCTINTLCSQGSRISWYIATCSQRMSFTPWPSKSAITKNKLKCYWNNRIPLRARTKKSRRSLITLFMIPLLQSMSHLTVKRKKMITTILPRIRRTTNLTRQHHRKSRSHLKDPKRKWRNRYRRLILRHPIKLKKILRL